LPSNSAAEVEKPPQQRAARSRSSRLRSRPSRLRRSGLSSVRPLRAGRRHLPHRGIHRPPPGRTARAPLARRRLRRLCHPRPRELLRECIDNTKVRQGPTVPLAPDVASALASSDAGTSCAAATTSSSSGWAAAASTAPRSGVVTKMLSAPQVRALRFHDLRHTFGTRMIAKADIRRVQEWMGHAHPDHDARPPLRPARRGRRPHRGGVRSRRRFRARENPS
jgi:integrase